MIDAEADIAGLEERALNAWPALSTLLADGWALRLAAGFTKRANSVTVISPAREDGVAALDARIAWAEAAYARHGLPAIFRLSPLAPASLDAALAARGYRHFDESLVQVAALDAGAPDAAVAVAPRADAAWCADAARLGALAPAQEATLARMLARIVPQAAFATLRAEEGRVVALGLAVAERGMSGLFEVMVDPARQGQGLGGRICRALMAWARDAAGARAAYLQVTAGNAPALALYRRLGFTTAYRYHYRVPADLSGVIA
ncbi:MAG: GNAT family N-acetyltransferase [Alphaproteobacteria bacterium]|nr:GNAT family N-acetyltransferase [Alphaproteobacteria bacterium]